MKDKIEQLSHALIQHGMFNNRIYLMKMDVSKIHLVLSDLDALAMDKGYGKIFAKVPATALREFLDHGYRIEAEIPKYFQGTHDLFFLGKYFVKEREVLTTLATIETVLKAAELAKRQHQGSQQKLKRQEHARYSFRIATFSDAPAIAELYKETFKTYPFPIDDTAYIKKTMAENYIYFTLWDQGQLIAVSSTEIYPAESSVEMTDFATRKGYEGQGFATFLLDQMEKEMITSGIKTAYTIARSLSIGMNKTFGKRGYTFGGTLKNNTQIAGTLESMNVWFKPLI